MQDFNIEEFNVIIENNGKFEPYNIMNYLKNTWKEFVKNYDEISKESDFNEDSEGNEYWKFPRTYKEIKKWVDNQLKYRYWGRCEYELVLSQWPYYELDEDTSKYKKGTPIIPNDKGKKIDIYEQCKMNMDVIIKIFMNNIYLN
ncbi:MAG: hypothetical protein J1F35_03250 [Erysipelotrichales bacterium]|nr:hypothetical protein [Erysipelotrichales bacterium]